MSDTTPAPDSDSLAEQIEEAIEADYKYLPAKAQVALAKISAPLLPMLGAAGIVVGRLTSGLDLEVAAFVMGGFLVASGVLHFIAGQNSQG